MDNHQFDIDIQQSFGESKCEDDSVSSFITQLKTYATADENDRLESLNILKRIYKAIVDDQYESTYQQKTGLNLILVEVLALIRNLFSHSVEHEVVIVKIVNEVFDDNFIFDLFNLLKVHIKNLKAVKVDSDATKLKQNDVLIVLRSIQFQYNCINLSKLLEKEEVFGGRLRKFTDYLFESIDINFLLGLCTYGDWYPSEYSSYMSKISISLSAVIYYCFYYDQQLQNKLIPVNSQLNIELWSRLLEHVYLEISEWSLWTLFSALKKEYFFQTLWENIFGDKQLLLIDVFLEFIDDEFRKQRDYSTLRQATNSKMPEEFRDINRMTIKFIPESCIEFLVSLFKKNIVNILQFGTNPDTPTISIDEFEVKLNCKFSSLLMKISSIEIYQNALQNNEELFKLLISILKSLQILARNKPDSIFGIRGQLKDINTAEENPVFGFKRNIVGMIANLTHKNTVAQDYLRESEGLAALLDCAKIDARNPFILQWSIFGIRNALENNIKNQNFIRELSAQGAVETDLYEKIT